MREIRFDDIEALKAEISGEFGEWGEPIRITQKMINDFADLTGDRQWIHLDIERAAASTPFNGTIAHGFLTLSLLPALQPRERFELVGFSFAANYGAERLRFLRAVPAESEVHCRRRLTAARRSRMGTLLTSESEVAILGSRRPALFYRGTALYQGSPEGSE